ncbi:MAG: ArsR/SmtB family transcription factor [Desulfococcaceae bacterium]
MSLVHVLKALADEKRLRILRLLLGNDLCVGALSRRLGVTEPSVSRHLRILRDAGLVKGEKRGYWTHYVVETEALHRIATEIGRMATGEAPPSGIAPCREPFLEGEEVDMCRKDCQHPEKLTSEPGKCTPEQIRECHGDGKEHPRGGEKPDNADRRNE